MSPYIVYSSKDEDGNDVYVKYEFMKPAGEVYDGIARPCPDMYVRRNVGDEWQEAPVDMVVQEKLKLEHFV